MDDERKQLLAQIRAETPMVELREWAWSILSTNPDDAATMVAEDPSVMDVVAAYVQRLETMATTQAPQ